MVRHVGASMETMPAATLLLHCKYFVELWFLRVGRQASKSSCCYNHWFWVIIDQSTQTIGRDPFLEEGQADVIGDRQKAKHE